MLHKVCDRRLFVPVMDELYLEEHSGSVYKLKGLIVVVLKR